MSSKIFKKQKIFLGHEDTFCIRHVSCRRIDPSQRIAGAGGTGKLQGRPPPTAGKLRLVRLRSPQVVALAPRPTDCRGRQGRPFDALRLLRAGKVIS